MNWDFYDRAGGEHETAEVWRDNFGVSVGREISKRSEHTAQPAIMTLPHCSFLSERHVESSLNLRFHSIYD